jgi:hypothetical protein
MTITPIYEAIYEAESELDLIQSVVHKSRREQETDRIFSRVKREIVELLDRGEDINAYSQQGSNYLVPYTWVQPDKDFRTKGMYYNSCVSSHDMRIDARVTPLRQALAITVPPPRQNPGFKQQKINLIQFLLGKGADPNLPLRARLSDVDFENKNKISENSLKRRSVELSSPLEWVAYNGDIDTVKLLITKGARVSVHSSYQGTSPLAMALYRSPPMVSIIKLLLKKGADPNVAEEGGVHGKRASPLEIILGKQEYNMTDRLKTYNIAKLLVESGAIPSKSDMDRLLYKEGRLQLSVQPSYRSKYTFFMNFMVGGRRAAARRALNDRGVPNSIVQKILHTARLTGKVDEFSKNMKKMMKNDRKHRNYDTRKRKR